MSGLLPAWPDWLPHLAWPWMLLALPLPLLVRRWLPPVRPALEGSHERFLHEYAEKSGRKSFMVLPNEEGRLPAVLRKTRLERAIGVIYRPRTERSSHYFRARLADQFDALIHIDRTTAVEPFDPWSELTHEDAPDTYPFAV